MVFGTRGVFSVRRCACPGRGLCDSPSRLCRNSQVLYDHAEAAVTIINYAARWLSVSVDLVEIVPEDRVSPVRFGCLFFQRDLAIELLIEESRRGVFRRLPYITVIRRAEVDRHRPGIFQCF